MSKRPAPSAEQLQAATRLLWRAGWPGWPHNPQATIDHPTYGACVRGRAMQLERAERSKASATTWWRGRLPQMGSFDARRAAANDRDD